MRGFVVGGSAPVAESRLLALGALQEKAGQRLRLQPAPGAPPSGSAPAPQTACPLPQLLRSCGLQEEKRSPNTVSAAAHGALEGGTAVTRLRKRNTVPLVYFLIRCSFTGSSTVTTREDRSPSGRGDTAVSTRCRAFRPSGGSLPHDRAPLGGGV